MGAGGKKLPASVLWRVFLRSFLLQASWNFERMQNLGVCYILAPALRFYYRERELVAAYRRHLDYFNTHPFMASPVIGTMLALEEQHSRGEAGELGVQEFKGMVMAPYAAMGDALFWGGIRPLAAGIALFVAVKGSLWAPVVFLALFNIPHLWLRISGLLRGYRLGLRVVESIQRYRFPDLAIRCKEGMVVLLGGLCAYLVFLCSRQEEVAAGWGLLALPVVLGLARLGRKGVSPLVLILGTAAAVVVLMQNS